MWILDRLEIARQPADLMFGSIAEDGSLGTAVLYGIEYYTVPRVLGIPSVRIYYSVVYSEECPGQEP